jgi:hypothetical protein
VCAMGAGGAHFPYPDGRGVLYCYPVSQAKCTMTIIHDGRYGPSRRSKGSTRNPYSGIRGISETYMYQALTKLLCGLQTSKPAPPPRMQSSRQTTTQMMTMTTTRIAMTMMTMTMTMTGARPPRTEGKRLQSSTCHYVLRACPHRTVSPYHPPSWA